MTRLLILSFLFLAACGAGRERVMTRDTGALDGVRSFLSTAFDERVSGGGLCGDPALVGEPAGTVEGEMAGCGIDEAVRLRAVGQVGLSQAALVDCATARALKRWVDDTAVPSLRKQGGGLAELKIAAHYVCRTRNHQPGAPISEHGRGKAIDISGFRLRDGSEVTVLNDWSHRKRGKALRRMHSEACGRFGTVLGPGSDGYHDDHFHFDTLTHPGGPYCR